MTPQTQAPTEARTGAREAAPVTPEAARSLDAVFAPVTPEAARSLDAVFAPVTPEAARSLDAVFAPVHSQTAFEETVDRLGTAIKLGLLAPGTRLPAERELCARLGIARSTLRQALVALGQSGHLRATRGRGGGTFITDPLPPVKPPSAAVLAGWREVCDERMTVEIGIAVLAAERARPARVDALDDLVVAIDGLLDDFSAYRQIDIRLHVGLSELTGSSRLVTLMTETQGAMSNLISHIAHPPEVLDSANDQHRRLLAAVRRHDELAAARVMAEHVRGTEHILAGLLPEPGSSLE